MDIISVISLWGVAFDFCPNPRSVPGVLQCPAPLVGLVCGLGKALRTVSGG